MATDTVDDFLEHFGVKGMKWGQRKKISRGEPSDDHKELVVFRKTPVPVLTNKQLKAANERMNLAQNFNRMNPKKTTIGKAHVTALLATIGIGVTAYNTFNTPAVKAFMNMGRRAAAGANMAKLLTDQARGNRSFS